MSIKVENLMREYWEDSSSNNIPEELRALFTTTTVEDVPICPQQDTWEVVESPKRLIKDFEFADFLTLQAFVTELLQYQESIEHHAKISIDYRTVRIETYTHDIDDITELDTELAKTADFIYDDVKDYIYE